MTPVDHGFGSPPDRVDPPASRKTAASGVAWPEKCGVCGAGPEHIRYDLVDGFTCNRCGASDSDE